MNALFDIAIVGAGPAGSFAAELLARTGARVALFDGRPHKEPKACGGGVTSKALRAWPHLLNAPSRTITRVEMISPSGKRLPLRLREPFAIYSRRALDGYLRLRAERAGAEIFKTRASDFARDGRIWTIRAKSGSVLRAKFLVAADGANSSFARRLAERIANADMEVAFGYRGPLTREVATVISFLPGWAGYAWAFPRLDHICFGIAVGQEGFDHDALDNHLRRFIVDYYNPRAASKEPPVDIDRLPLVRYAARIPGLSAETLDRRRTVGDGWALLGDAAGFADPVTGEGIYYALRSAELFAQSLAQDAARSYEERWREDFGQQLRRAAQMRRRFYGDLLGAPFSERMIELGRAHRGVRRTLRELIAGDQGYVDLKRTLFRRFFWPFD
ncbi:MAG: hypothetical protein C4334_03970 [Pyrinomonas sp.]|uniref:NAD(P)/FAD-dependent oxidoreductase n=1 Tax=Pyrinomonas sp. TaxID=2080306 RepID=UPI00332F2772